MRQFLAVAAIAAIASAQAGDDIYGVGETNDERPYEISGDWQETPTNDNRDVYKVAKDDDWTLDDEDALNDTIWNGEGEEPAGDGESRPLCTIAGFENKVDNQGPSNQCCRIYEYSLYKGRFRDFCIQEDLDDYCTIHDSNNGGVDTLFRTIQLDDYGWHNEMNSWKCGSKVTIEACAYPEDDKDKQHLVHPKTGDSEQRKAQCNSGILFNRAMGADWSDRIDQISIGVAKPPCCTTPDGPICPPEHPEVCIATVYSDGDCGGASKKIRSDVLYRPKEWEPINASIPYATRIKGSWDHYNGAFWEHFGNGMNQSVLFEGRCAIEVFNHVNFQSESFTMRQDPSKNYSCKEAQFIGMLNGWAWGTGQGAANFADSNGYSGYLAW